MLGKSERCSPPAVAGAACQADLLCDCDGYCNTRLKLTVEATGDDTVVPLICG